MSSIERKFNRGDVVRHRASGETAVVVYPLMRCVNPSHATGFVHVHGFGNDCTLEFSGSYRLDVGFSSEDFDYPQDLLKPFDYL